MRNLFAFGVVLALLMASCKKDDITPTPDTIEPAQLMFQGTASLPDGTEMDCAIFDEMYLSKRLDFGSMLQQHVGSVTFNDDGTCTNHWSGDDSFLSWSYWSPTGETFCNVLVVKMKDQGTGDTIETMFTFTKYTETETRASRVDNSDLYVFFPL